MNWFEAMVLGLIQGLTEFLPVSSSGHLEIAKSLFRIDPDTSFYFTVAVHGATVLSTVVVFWQEIRSLFIGSLKLKLNEETSYTLKIFISMIPVGIAGILLKGPIEKLYDGNIVFVGMMLIFTSLLLAMAHFIKKRERSIGYKDAFIIGIAQAIAVIPGISRSGSTIATGLLIGNKKNEIARFSFLMVLIPIIGANFLEIISGQTNINSGVLGIVIIGFITAFTSGYFACRWMITLVRQSKLIWFSLYCAIIGLLAILNG
ncbi:MAG TPA: undecaprenyl-diphosphate phosphatase [Bacteroidales bacterium]|nr:undecaprenyl-diphosphate phosphatase [Bacteroidales bacterium]